MQFVMYSVDGLLCMLNTDSADTYENFLHYVYSYYRSQAIPDTSYTYTQIPNPYFNADPFLTLDYRFLPDSFMENWNGYNVKLSYLVSHLDGINLQNVYNIIDRSADADTSGNGWWIIDDDPTLPGYPSHFYMEDAKENLSELTSNVVYNTNDIWITKNDNGSVIGYTSWGVHAGMDSIYWIDTLKFNYLSGAIATTNESFNGNSLTTLVWRAKHGLITQFTELNKANSGGSGFSGNAWEPYDENITRPDIYFPGYAAGYNQVDAAYMGTLKIAWENIIQGDPLTRIGNLVTIDTMTGTLQNNVNNIKIIVPEGGTLTIQNSIDILNYGGIKVIGKLIISSGVNINLYKHGLIQVEKQGEIIFERNSSIYSTDNASIKSIGTIKCAEGVEIGGSSINISNKFFADGLQNSLVSIFNISINNIDTLIANYVNFNSIDGIINDSSYGYIKITHSEFITSPLGVKKINRLELDNNYFSVIQNAVAIDSIHYSII